MTWLGWPLNVAVGLFWLKGVRVAEPIRGECTVCKLATAFVCADCGIDKVKTYVCLETKCVDEHNKVCPSMTNPNVYPIGGPMERIQCGTVGCGWKGRRHQLRTAPYANGGCCPLCADSTKISLEPVSRPGETS